MRFAIERKEEDRNKKSVFDDDYVLTDEDREVIAEINEALKINGIDPDDDRDDYELVKTEYGYAMCKKEDVEKVKLEKLDPPIFYS